MIKIAHEAPISYFDQVQQQTDYDYALVHLFEESEEYYSKFYFALKRGREVILDNSIFELGESFDKDKYYGWILKLNPTYYIIPDVLEDAEGTVKNAQEWQYFKDYKTIGVVQGKTYDEIVWCYKEMDQFADKLAISFDYSLYTELVYEYAYDEVVKDHYPTKYHVWARGRQILLERMVSDGIINTSKPHHLLGCGLPQEFKAYRNYSFIDSLDTSNPVVSGISRLRYNGLSGLTDKPTVKLFTLINDILDREQKQIIDNNIDLFRMMVNE